MPIGLRFALSENLEAMNSFARLDTKNQEIVIERARNVNSKEEMHSLVKNISRDM